ncbi:MAG: DUF2480 family protein [Bacteroidetes bacterium]|nr:DUF2480 family protein [Bacteroidota bacterium]
MEAIVNKVAESGLITLNLEDFLPKEEACGMFDLKQFLFMELILKEKDFRQSLKDFHWQTFENKYVAVYCSADAIIPLWAYMLSAVYLQQVAKEIFYGTVESMKEQILLNEIEKIDTENFVDKRIVIKGCGDATIPASAYFSITKKLKPFVKSLMYGEPCSTVPVYKKK